MRRCGRIVDNRDVCKVGNGLLQKLQALRVRIRHHQGSASKVPSWAREASHMPTAERVGMAYEHDWYGCGGLLGCASIDGCRGNDNINVEPHEFVGKLR